MSIAAWLGEYEADPNITLSGYAVPKPHAEHCLVTMWSRVTIFMFAYTVSISSTLRDAALFPFEKEIEEMSSMSELIDDDDDDDDESDDRSIASSSTQSSLGSSTSDIRKTFGQKAFSRIKNSMRRVSKSLPKLTSSALSRFVHSSHVMY